MATAPSPPPLGLYVHLPWCERKCPYCDFNSHGATEFPEADYVRCLLADLSDESPRFAGRMVESIFIGGGTPSLFSESAIADLLEGVSRSVILASDCEVTLEANPGSAETGRFAGYRAAGVNRLSIGAQSFDDGALARIGRIHDGGAALAAISGARAAGFRRINVDLMYGLPEQTLEAALADLAKALDTGVTHLSHYELTLEPNTLFHRFPPTLPDEDVLWDMHEAGMAALAEAGLNRYEISAYAAPDEACRHNLNYWRFGDYIGIGAGAHGKRTGGGVVERSIKHRHPRRYLAVGAGEGYAARRAPVATGDLPLEFVLNAGRLLEGFSEALFEARTGLPVATVEAPLARAEALGLVGREAGVVRPTERGIQFLNELLALFDGSDEAPAGGGKRAPVHRVAGPPVL